MQTPTRRFSNTEPNIQALPGTIGADIEMAFETRDWTKVKARLKVFQETRTGLGPPTKEA